MGFDHDLRRHPAHVAPPRLGRRNLVEPWRVDLERMQPLPQDTRHGARVARADAPGIDQPAAVIIAHGQSTHGLRQCGGGRIAADHELLRIRALGLDEALRAAAAIRCVAALGDDAFEPHPAGMIEHRRPIVIQMLAVSDRPAPLPDQTRELRLALRERQTGKIAAVTVKEIEDVVDEPLAVTCLECRLQTGERGDAACVLDHDLAIDQRGTRRQLGHGVGDVRKSVRPIEALARQQPDLAMVKPRLDAIAVELDLVDPAPAAGSCRAQRGERRRHEEGKRRTMRPGFLALGAALLIALHAALLGAGPR